MMRPEFNLGNRKFEPMLNYGPGVGFVVCDAASELMRPESS